MMKPIFRGAATAIATPMKQDGSVDYEAFGRLIEFQIREGISALVVVGTTGEGSTLSDREHREVIDYFVQKVNGRVPVIAGTGSNDTAYSVSLSRFACEAGVDGLLCVTPYYNKATQKGLIASFSTVADAVTKPIILYNVPSRTGCNIKPETCLVLSRHPNIAGVKEASGDISQVADIRRLCGDGFAVYSGNDDQIVPILSLGGDGVISVLSNILPAQTESICRMYFEGKVKESAELQLKLLPLIHALFSEVNPIPVKAALARMGYGENALRLPLTPMDEALEEKLLFAMREAGISV